MLARLLLSSVIIGALSAPAAGQTPAAGQALATHDAQVLDSIGSQLRAIQLRAGNKDKRLSDLCDSVAGLAATLKAAHEKLRDRDDGLLYTQTTDGSGSQVTLQSKDVYTTTLTDEYVSSLEADSELLKRVSEPKVSSGEVYQALLDVKEDLEIKLAHVNAGKFVEVKTVVNVNSDPSEPVTTYDTQVGRIAVVVETKREDNTAVPGYEVYFVAKGLAGDQTRHKSFSTLSSPTKPQYLAPGNYFMWAVKASKSTTRRLVKIGAGGSSESVDLSVPND
jgi:hypothetical protein